jgi:putative transferase (TIGR04331 family)
MDMGASSPRAIADARLVVVFDHPATMFLESIFVEKPTLAIASTLGEYRQEYLPHVRFLLECGILHQTVESLVERLEGVVEEPAKWWNEVKSSQGYAKYKATYCGWVQADPAG